METLAAVDLLRSHFPDLSIQVVNVVDLLRLQHESEGPHGLSDTDFDALFTTDKPVIFANHGNFHVHGFREEGTTTTPFDMCVPNRIDRFHLAMAVIDRVPRLKNVSATVREKFKNALIEHHQYIRTHGEDMPEIDNWQWTAVPGPGLQCEQEAREEPL